MRTNRRRTVCSPLQSICEASVCATGDKMIEFELENWRRRPDLNRGWRFCRQGRDVYLVDSSCFLVGPTPPFSLVFGRNCSQVVPNYDGGEIPSRPGRPDP